MSDQSFRLNAQTGAEYLSMFDQAMRELWSEQGAELEGGPFSVTVGSGVFAFDVGWEDAENSAHDAVATARSIIASIISLDSEARGCVGARYHDEGLSEIKVHNADTATFAYVALGGNERREVLFKRGVSGAWRLCAPPAHDEPAS